MGAPQPKRLNQKSAESLLRSVGWRRTLGGKHVVKMEKAGHRPITLPHHRGGTYSAFLTNAILRQAGLKDEAEADDEGER